MTGVKRRPQPPSPVIGMPRDLRSALWELGRDTRSTAMENWAAIGADGQKQLVRYIDRALFRRTRRGRCRLAALQLVNPTVPMRPSPQGGPPYGGGTLGAGGGC
jgi:hypothetical protein